MKKWQIKVSRRSRFFALRTVKKSESCPLHVGHFIEERGKNTLFYSSFLVIMARGAICGRPFLLLFHFSFWRLRSLMRKTLV